MGTRRRVLGVLQPHDAPLDVHLSNTQRRNLGQSHAGLNGNADDPAEHRVRMLIDGLQQAVLFCGSQSPVAARAGDWVANVGHGIEGQANAPFLDLDGEQVAQQGWFQAYRVVTARPWLAIFVRVTSQSHVTELRHDLGVQGGREYLPRWRMMTCAYLCSPAWVEARLVGVTSLR